jgi:thymidylate synthase ThyX
MQNGKFFVFEGIDGCGKATQTRLLADYYRQKGFAVEKIDFPQHGERSSAMVDDYLTGKYGSSEEVGPEVASIFYATDRYDASHRIKKWLSEGKIVISDRYLVSNIGHQGGKIKDKSEWKKYVNWLYNLEYGIFQVPKPDYTFILKTSVEFSLKLANKITDEEKRQTRINYLGDDKKQDIHEKDSSHLENALSSYLMVAREFPNDFVVVECLENGELLPAEIINQKVIKIIEENKKHMSAERRIYTLPNNLMPEVKAVTFAKCSRSAEPFDKIAQELTDEKSAEFHEKWVVGFGHSSIAEHAVISLAVENVSNIATKVIEDSRLASFTEKSSRYQIFNKDKLYMPEEIMNSELKEVYLDAVNSLMDTYEEMTPAMMDFVKQKYPRLPDGQAKPAYQDEKLYNMVSKARACDNLRYLLPSAVLTNLGMTINTRELEHLIAKLLSHPLKEMQDIGNEMKKNAMEAVPTLLKFANKNNYIVETKKQLSSIAKWELGKEAGNNQAVTIVNYDKDATDKLIAGILYPYSDLSYEEIAKKVRGLSDSKKERIIDETLSRREKFDQPLRELEHIYYTFDILLDYGAFRDVQRHRMCTQSNQPVTVAHGYDLPPEIREAGFEDKFKAVVEKSVQAFSKIYEKFPEEAQYVVPMCFRKRVLITWNLRELHHFISLRSGKKGHASYRRIAQQCWRELNKIQPLLAKYIRVDMDEMNVSWAASLENKDFYYNPYATRGKSLEN